MKLLVDIQKPLPALTLEVAFTVEKTLSILGASGSGKSMTLRCIAGLETPKRGRIELNGRVLFDSQKGINLPPRDRRIGFLFQNYALFPHLTVAQNIAYGLPKLTSAQARACVAEHIALVQLQGLEHRYPQQLSGGQQQRVALARALASQPEVLLMDEPFSALDTHLRDQLEKQLISTLATYQGVTLFVTHNLEEAYRICQDLLVIEQGKAIAYGAKHHIFDRPTTKRVAQLTGCKNISNAVVTVTSQVEATGWGCTLQVIESLPDSLSHIGIRAHQLTFTNNPNQENTFPCWLAQTSETPHRMTLYLKLHSSPTSPQDYHLQAEVFKEKWHILKDQPFPLYLYLDPMRLILMK
jgi:ABC-type sulfate/molybdate transport systems ATPase subunit